MTDCLQLVGDLGVRSSVGSDASCSRAGVFAIDPPTHPSSRASESERRVDVAAGPSARLRRTRTRSAARAIGRDVLQGAGLEVRLLDRGEADGLLPVARRAQLSLGAVPGEYDAGSDLLFDAQRRGRRYEWRLLVPDDRQVGDLFDAVHAGLPAGIAVGLDGVGTPNRWGENLTTIADVPHEQRDALEAAVSMGYYETPRAVTVAELADVLDVPTSTCRYRLRRAEALVTTRFVAENALAGDGGDVSRAMETP